ncbi:unnamed protein product, partial [marine sediment metagenome]
KEKGALVITALLVLGVLLLLSAYFLTFTLAEARISKSQTIASQTYYLTEAAIYEAIWKLKNDPDWQTNFETMPGCQTWSASFSRSNTLLPNGSYQIDIQNLACARGQIVATGIINLPDGKTAQRIIKTEVFKAIGNPVEDIAVFAGGGGKKDELKIKDSIINIYDGNIFSNAKIKIEGKNTNVTIIDNPETTEKLEGQILAVKEYEEKDSAVTAAEIHAENEPYTPAADSLFMPMVDFDSRESSSHKSQAQTKEDEGKCQILCNDSSCTSSCNGGSCD